MHCFADRDNMIVASKNPYLPLCLYTFPFPFMWCQVARQAFCLSCFFKYLVVRHVGIIPHCDFTAWARDQRNQRETWQQACKCLANRHLLMLPGFWHACLRRNWNLSLSASIHLRHITSFLSSLGCGYGTCIGFFFSFLCLVSILK